MMTKDPRPPYITHHLEHSVSSEIKDGLLDQPFFHHHNGYEFFLLMEGSVSFYIGKECYFPEPGTLFLIPPNVYHRMVCTPQSTTYRRAIIYILPQFINSLSTASTDLLQCFKGRAHDQTCSVKLTEEQQEHFIQHASLLDQYIKRGEYGDDLRVQISVIHLMLSLNSIFQTTLPTAKNLMPRIVADTVAYIDQHLTEDFSIDLLAKSLYHNRSYISRTFHETMGITLQQYIIEKRIFLAATLLENGETISNACDKSGFRNYANFIRTFKKNIGVPPLRYQKDYLTNQKNQET